MKDHPNQNSRVIARHISLAEDYSSNLASQETVDLFNEIERNIIEEIGELNEYEVIELKRRIAEAKIANIYSKKEDIAGLFDREWAELENLGFSSADRETSMLFFRAKHLLEHESEPKSIEMTLARMRELVNGRLAEQSKSSAEHFNRTLTRLQAELDAKF